MKHPFTFDSPSLVFIMLISYSALIGAEPADAETPALSFIQLVGKEDADCAMKDGQMMLLASSSQDHTIEVWVDRWFMEVQTADHTKHVLSIDTPTSLLGCSNTLSGKQRWTIHSAKVLP
ncbi:MULTISPECIES: hypothetical protein [unclassified Methylotenera]|jgi:hypothetical protein|uniref:hypothetical protein n=1 Tax=unclassified Methylotenera TaxID=2643294 RepID=UPI00037CBC09|nr:MULTISPECIES: hypothetical protein [unclassified Methylotenera]